ncbi:unnamed protein product [Lampetra planeri]
MLAGALLVALGLLAASASKQEKVLSQEHYVEGEHNPDYDREALFGGEESLEEFSKLNPEEAARRLQALVSKIDANGDGFLSKDELSRWTMQSFRRYATEETRERFPEVDRDGDGAVSWDEYRQHEYENLPGGADEAAAAGGGGDGGAYDDEERSSLQSLYAREKKKFGKADSDGVQGLNITEFLAFEHPEEFDYMQDSVLEEALLEHDKDGDGFVDLAEFLGDYHRDPTAESDPEWVITETDKFTSEFDIDHDGRLNPSELLSWLMPNNLEVAEDETEHLLEHMDTDGDGQLSHDEVVQNKELFLTSEVTDYGRQLGEQYAHHEEL